MCKICYFQDKKIWSSLQYDVAHGFKNESSADIDLGEEMQTMTTVGKVVRRGWALFALPTVLCFAVFFVVPLAMGIYLSFT